MPVSEYAELDGLGLAALVRERKVSALELVDEAITRIETLNPRLNAIVYPMYDHARKLAAQPQSGTFAGVPFLLKDMTSFYAGTPTTHGCKVLANIAPSDHDSELVKRFKRAGLITVAKTSTPELALSATTEPTFRGPARNPWSLDHTTGGSSGGSAAAVAARIVPIAHGGDGGGSLRMPASCCGIVGFKPSRMRTPHGPDCSSIWESCCGEFVMSRSVRDSAYLLDEVAGQDVGAYYAAPAQARPFRDEVASDPRALRIAWSAGGPAHIAAHADCVAAVEHCAKLAAGLGHHVEESCPQLSADFIETMGEAFMAMLAIETAQDMVEISALVGRRPAAADYEPANWALAEIGRGYSAVDAVRFKRVLHEAARRVGPFFEQYDIYLAPTLGKPPVPIGEIDPRMQDSNEYFRLMFDFMPFTSLFNICGSAAVSLPLWWNAQGLPIGCQFVTRMGNDGLLLQLAAQIERAQPWAGRRPALVAN